MKILSLITLGNGVKMSFEIKRKKFYTLEHLKWRATRCSEATSGLEPPV